MAGVEAGVVRGVVAGVVAAVVAGECIVNWCEGSGIGAVYELSSAWNASDG